MFRKILSASDNGHGCAGHDVVWMTADHENLEPFRNAPIITGKTVTVAPVYQWLDPSAPLAMDLTVIAIIGDRIAQPKFHVEPLYEAARKQVRAVFETIAGHHYGFTSPSPNG